MLGWMVVFLTVRLVLLFWSTLLWWHICYVLAAACECVLILPSFDAEHVQQMCARWPAGCIVLKKTQPISIAGPCDECSPPCRFMGPSKLNVRQLCLLDGSNVVVNFKGIANWFTTIPAHWAIQFDPNSQFELGDRVYGVTRQKCNVRRVVRQSRKVTLLHKCCVQISVNVARPEFGRFIWPDCRRVLLDVYFFPTPSLWTHTVGVDAMFHLSGIACSVYQPHAEQIDRLSKWV